MFKSAATRIAHNTTIPALAGNSDLRPLQDLITAEKTVLTTLQKLRIDFAKAGDALRIWGQGEGDDLGDILTASSTILTHFAAALTTYSSLHHTVRDSMKSVRTREEGLDELRRRRRRVGASAEAAEKKLNKMSPEHKNLSFQTDTLNKLREEMRALDGEILREETELGDYKRKCARDWMSFKFGGLVECCEKGVIVGDIGRQIIQSVPEDVTQPGFPRAHYDAHGRVGDLVVEAQRAVSQVNFSSNPTGHTAVLTSQPQPSASQGPPVQSPFLPTPSLGSELTLGVPTYNPPPGPPPGHTPAVRRASVDELGVHAPTAHAAPQFSSLPGNRERDPLVSSSVGPTQPLTVTVPYDGGASRTEENQSLMASIADALSQSHRGFSLEDATSIGHPTPDEPVPKYESISPDLARSAQSEPHGPATNGHAGPPPLTQQGEGQRRTMRRSTSPPSLPPGAAPAAIRAWDDRMGQGEDGAHSDRPVSSSADVPSQRPISSSERDGEEEDGLAYDRKSPSFEEDVRRVGDGKHHDEGPFSESGGEASVDETEVHDDDRGTTHIQGSLSTSSPTDGGDTTLLSRAGSQWRIPRVPPPSADPGEEDVHQLAAHRRHSFYSTGTGARDDEDLRTDESADQRARNAAAVREVSREMDALAFSAAVLPPSGYTTPKGHGMTLSTQGQAAAPYLHASPPLPPSPSGRAPYGSAPPSPIMPPNPPFANRSGTSAMMEVRQARGHHPAFSEGGPPRLPTPTPTFTPPTAGGVGLPTIPGSTPPMYPRPAPPFSSPLMASSTSSLNNGVEGGPRTISAAAFRRQQARSPSGADGGPADTSPLTLRKPSGSPLPSLSTSRQFGPGPTSPVPMAVIPKARLSVVNPDPRTADEEEGHEFDYIAAYGGENMGYGAGRYVSDLEKER